MNAKTLLATLASGAFALLAAQAADFGVSGTKFQQRYPWNGLVDIDFTVTCATGSQVDLAVTATDLASSTALSTAHVWLLDGTNRISSLRVGPGKHRLLWDAGQDAPNVVSKNVRIGVRATAAELRYLVIDLSQGVDAVSYPVTYLSDIPGGAWSDEYKTTKLVMRRIEPGNFKMGSPASEVGRFGNETRHSVTLTNAYYIGVFEVTQRQWELVMGTKPSYFKNASYYAKRPVEKVSYNTIRGSSSGAKWPASADVDASSFIGILRSKTGDAKFDLPTEAQWEYACRAGTQTSLNNSRNVSVTDSGVDAALSEVGRYYANGGSGSSETCSTANGTAVVGTYKPNAWGLYDMHGNVYEWCLDWYTSSIGAAAVTNPNGPSSGSYRVHRSGSWYDYAQICRSAYRNGNTPSCGNNSVGLRLCR